MGFARTFSVALLGLSGHMIEVEADIGQTLPAFVLLGLPDTALMESRERIRSAAKNSGLPLVPRKITVSLTPATLPKTGSAFDLAIVMATVQASGYARPTEEYVFLAELGLDGSLRPVPGVFPAVNAAVAAGYPRVVVASENRAEAELVPGARVHGFEALADVLEWSGAEPSKLVRPPARRIPREPAVEDRVTPDLSDVLGQEEGRWALEIAAAGGHHVSMVGPPGAGKTMLAERLPGILPRLDAEASQEVTAVHSIGSRKSRVNHLIVDPPWEAPHHTATAAAIVGGGTGIPQPGAISRAHHGVLFLDEAPEFRRGVLDALRQPLESGWVTIDRARASAHYPAKFQLVVAANPCPCGRSSGMADQCTCSSRERRTYLSKISGPFADRIDMHIRIPKLSSADVAARRPAERSAEVLARVVRARQAARERLEPLGISTNAQLRGRHLRHQLRLSPKVLGSLTRLLDRGDVTLRGCDRIQRVAWSLADLAGVGSPRIQDIDAAIGLRIGSGVKF
ncbi:YifB family Mg chelatase-like AAA ATPase [Rothia uropygialis]|uniref:YifB family Mg chelatase-like AAA ATPase n=1 Tax=Kocuria sp. 36 TaxID=1415402 RepID=UPI00101D1AD3|nr:YifB family Mg chelatase-like AAA ATPase [Kocuria sp. 36]